MVVVLATRDRRTNMWYLARTWPMSMGRTGMRTEMLKDLAKLGHRELIFKCDGEPALRGAREEVQRRRDVATI